VAEAAQAGGISIPYAQPGPQAAMLRATWCPEIGYGGARGGAKTASSLLDYMQDVPKYGKGWRGIIFRKTFPELEEVIYQAKEFFLPAGAEYHETKKTFFFREGATFKLRALEKQRDAEKFQGHQYTWMGWDELGNWASLRPYDMLKACLRSPYDVPTKRIRATFNPGGVGHHEVKRRFVDPCVTGYKLITDDEYGTRLFIPARVQDNKILLANDPGYIARLRQVGSPQLVKAWLEGDFTAIEGAFFPEFGSRHIIPPFTIPDHWHKVRGYDHGYAAPFSVLWAAVSTGKLDDYTPCPIPKGALVVYREWYGHTGSGQGLRIDPREIAHGIKAQEAEELVDSVADPAIFATQGGPSIAEELYEHGVKFRRADNERLPGWMQLRLRLKAEPDPMLYVFSTCPQLIEHLPIQQHDPRHPEDLDTTGEDHDSDTLRYICMSRPYAPPYNSPEPMRQWTETPLTELVKASRRRKKRKL
jgi:hypothetical protein